MDKTPLTLTIDHFDYPVSFVPQHVVDPDKAGFVGHESFVDGNIVILETMDDRRKTQVLIHEVLHIIAEHRNMKLSELKYDAIAYGLLQFLLDNPAFCGLIESLR